jgi:hypothetical protein
MTNCTVDGCKNQVDKPGHDLCHKHWILNRDGKLTKCTKCGRLKDDDKPLCLECWRTKNVRSSDHGLTATVIGERNGLKADRVNTVFSELGWIMRGPANKGWISLPQGNKQGAANKEHPQSGAPFVVWPESILENSNFKNAILALKGDLSKPEELAKNKSEDLGFRQKFPAEFRATDGHMVRSRAEVIIDNWLYVNGLVHAYERQVPIQEDLYCDFYLPSGRVYIEYWGMEKDPAYAARMAAKKMLYASNSLRLIELGDADIQHLDDVLPKKLLAFEISVT